MADTHAKLHPSASGIWLNCAAQPRMVEGIEWEPPEFMAAGTLAHEKAEEVLLWGGAYFDSPEQQKAVTEYADFVENLRKDGELLIEKYFDLPQYHTGGTPDSVVIYKKALHIIDFKYGAGVPVSAQNNTQLMIYALAVLDGLENSSDVEDVRLHIIQPRTNAGSSSWAVSVEDLYKWEEETLAPAVERVKESGTDLDSYLNPGAWCSFCAALGVKCKAAASTALEVVKANANAKRLTMPEVESFTPEEISRFLVYEPIISKFCKNLKAHALKIAQGGEKIPGYKVVEGRANRQWKSEAAVIDAFPGVDIWEPKKILSPAKLEKLDGVKKKDVAALVYKAPGKPTLAPASDKRKELGADMVDIGDLDFLE